MLEGGVAPKGLEEVLERLEGLDSGGGPDGRGGGDGRDGLDGGGGRLDDGREGGRGEKIVSMKERKLGTGN